jgi:hypothetical protein
MTLNELNAFEALKDKVKELEEIIKGLVTVARVEHYYQSLTVDYPKEDNLESLFKKLKEGYICIKSQEELPLVNIVSNNLIYIFQDLDIKVRVMNALPSMSKYAPQYLCGTLRDHLKEELRNKKIVPVGKLFIETYEISADDVIPLVQQFFTKWDLNFTEEQFHIKFC